MKYFSFLLTSCLLPAAVSAQHLPAAQLPEAVRRAFNQAQPRATQVSWHRQGTAYEATFRRAQDKKLRAALLLTSAGEVIESRTDIAYSDFPPLGRTQMSQRFPHRQVDRITKVVSSSGKTTYVVQVCKGKDRNGKDKNCQTTVFDENGRPETQ